MALHPVPGAPIGPDVGREDTTDPPTIQQMVIYDSVGTRPEVFVPGPSPLRRAGPSSSRYVGAAVLSGLVTSAAVWGAWVSLLG